MLPEDSLPVFPVVTFTGPARLSRLYHGESGAMSGFAGLLTLGQQVVLDHARRSVVGDKRSLYFNRMPGTVFFPLRPGVNSLAYNADAHDPSALVTVQWRPRYP
jgi:hypothetical protein